MPKRVPSPGKVQGKGGKLEKVRGAALTPPLIGGREWTRHPAPSPALHVSLGGCQGPRGRLGTPIPCQDWPVPDVGQHLFVGAARVWWHLRGPEHAHVDATHELLRSVRCRAVRSYGHIDYPALLFISGLRSNDRSAWIHMILGTIQAEKLPHLTKTVIRNRKDSPNNIQPICL